MSYLTDLKNTRKTKLFFQVVWTIALLFCLGYRGLILFKFSFKYTDFDQTVLWYMASLISHFEYYSLNYPGQEYGSCLEAVLAVPLYWMNIPLYICLPLITSILWMIPYVLTSYILMRNNKIHFSLLILFLSLCSSLDVDIISTVPRGFIPGLVLAFIGAILLTKKKKSNLSIYLALILFVIAYYNNQNSLTISLIGILFFVVSDFHNIKKYSKGMICGIISDLFLALSWNLSLLANRDSVKYEVKTEKILFIRNFTGYWKNVCECLADFSFSSDYVLNKIPLLVIGVFLILLYAAIKRKSIKLIVANICTIVGTLLMFLLFRANIYTYHYLYKQSRMFLFVPLLIILLVYWTADLYNDSKMQTNFSNIVVICLILGVLVLKIFSFEEKIEYYDTNNAGKVSELADFSEEVSRVLVQNDSDTLLFYSDINVTLYYYAFASLKYDEYDTYYLTGDRFWDYVSKKSKGKSNENVMVLNISEDSGMNYFILDDNVSLYQLLLNNMTKQTDYYYEENDEIMINQSMNKNFENRPVAE